ncbi:OPT superfamily [Umbelopsis sp. WA50703]
MSSDVKQPTEQPIDEKQTDVLQDELVKEDVIEENFIDYENDPEYKDIPLVVRELVTFDDDPEQPSLTFRYYLLSFVFVGLGAFVSQLSWFRTTSAPYSVFFVQIVSHWAGKWLAKVLPNKEVNLYIIKFNLNPGPFSVKEHVLVTLSASAGATSNLGEIIVSVKELFYDEYMHPVAAIAFMWATIWTGYSYAALARSFLIYDPTFIWPQALMQTTLFRTLRADENIFTARKQMRVFWLCLVGVFFWQFLPEYAFPLLSSLAVLCWFGGHNPTVAFVGSGLGGMGVLNFTLDWSNITSTIMLSPWWTQVIQFVAFVISVWILVPIAKFKGLWGSDKIPIMSNHLFLANGTLYPFQQLITADAQFNETAYEEYGPVYMSSYQMWNLFFGYASFLSAFVSIALFAGPKLVKVAKLLLTREKRQDEDKLNKLMSPYKDVPLWWYLTLFLICFITNMVLIFKEQLYLPWWTFIVALVIGALTVVPMGYVYAISNYQVDIGTFNGE